MNIELLCAALLHGEQWMERFRLKTYAEAFQDYINQYGPVYRQALAETGGGDGGLNDLAAGILDSLEEHWKREHIWNRSVVRQGSKQLLVSYLSPMLLALESPEAKTLCGLLRDGWTARRPRDTYRIASFERIQNGFKNAIMGIEIKKPVPEQGDDL